MSLEMKCVVKRPLDYIKSSHNSELASMLVTKRVVLMVIKFCIDYSK